MGIFDDDPVAEPRQIDQQVFEDLPDYLAWVLALRRDDVR
jgi:hypothetical protein